MKRSAMDLRSRRRLEHRLEPDALVAYVARIRGLFGRGSYRAQCQHVLLAEAHLVVLKAKYGRCGNHAQGRRGVHWIGVVVGVLDELKNEVHIAGVQLASESVDCPLEDSLHAQRRFCGKLC